MVYYGLDGSVRFRVVLYGPEGSVWLRWLGMIQSVRMDQMVEHTPKWSSMVN